MLTLFGVLREKFRSSHYREEIGLLILIALYIVLSYYLAFLNGFADRVMPVMYLDTGITLSITLCIGYFIYYLMRAVFLLFKHKPQSPIAFLTKDLKAGPFNIKRLKHAFFVMLGFFFFFSTFTSMKFLIPQIHAFSWDEFFKTADNFLHFGFDPWFILQPILGHIWITKLLDFIYIFWLPSVFFVLYWQAFSQRDPHIRIRFLYSFVMVWALNGTFLAVFFSSAGPCYYEHVMGFDYFTPLMEYLKSAHEQINIYAISTQELLWNNYQDESMLQGGGISAFPSIHVATAFLFVLLGKQINKYWYCGFLVFFIAIFLGSVHLGWHYALDGYFSILSTYFLWWLSGRCKNQKRKAKI